MKVVILCDSKETRLRDETEFSPKTLVKVGKKPLIWHIMKIYGHYGFNEFVICLGHKGDMIKEYFLNYEIMNNDITIELTNQRNMEIHNNSEREDWKVTLVNTGENTQTGARIKKIEKYIDGNTFLLTYGNNVARININKLVDFHRKHNKIGTVTGVPSSRFGEFYVKNNRVTEISEKPQSEAYLKNGGFFVFDTAFFDYLNDKNECIMEKQPLKNLAADGELMFYYNNTFWQSVNTYQELEYLNNYWEQGNPPWKVWGGLIE